MSVDMMVSKTKRHGSATSRHTSDFYMVLLPEVAMVLLSREPQQLMVPW